ncbi:hypothetical protein POM88_054040 [Heracleum sosnowskyi]|uniref:chorismate mutase n=1 Tax=Heracleum sosnowskyi TaxID=360622 RepID=A0AAD8GMZ8_9APIA|nr:hypothetical protein POM88_054040 [Heracleum sosnowskyi]
MVERVTRAESTREGPEMVERVTRAECTRDEEGSDDVLGGQIPTLQLREQACMAQLMDLLAYSAVEEVIIRKVEMKTRSYSQEVMEDEAEPVNKYQVCHHKVGADQASQAKAPKEWHRPGT